MKATKMTVGLVTAIAMLALAMPTQAVMIFNMEFDVDGVYPSTEGSLPYSGQRAETEWYTPVGGLLEQRTSTNSTHPTTSNATAIYYTPDFTDPTKSLLIQAQAAFFGGFGLGVGGAVWVQDGANNFGFGFGSSGIHLQDSSSTTIAVPDTAMHLYELESPANSNAIIFRVDGATVFTGTAMATTDANFIFGDGSKSGDGADLDWDFVRVFNPVPEPATLGLMAIGGLMMLRRRRA